MRRILKKSFFNRPTNIAAQELLGKFLVRKTGRKETSFMITEVEVYDGSEDRASHAARGKTSRTKVMFGEPGVFYVYLCYGMYYMLNVITREKDYPAAILIRGLKNDEPGVTLNGPGKITKFLGIDRNLNLKKARKASGLWFEDRGVVVPNAHIKKTPRIGVGYAGPIWSKKMLRFTL